MRSMNVKKLAALGLAAAVVGAPLAHAEINTANLPTDKAWYKDAAVVVGTTAQYEAKISDGVWAGNIAAVIANMAYVSQEQKSVEVNTENAEVTLSVPGEVVVSGEGYDDQTSLDYDGTEWSKTYDHAKITPLADSEDLDFDYKKSTETTYSDGDAEYTEELNVQVNAQVGAPEDSDTAELRATTVANELKYKLTISDLLGDEVDTSASDTTYEFRNFDISVLGDEYEVKEIYVDSGFEKIKLVRNSQTVILNEGETVDVDGYTIKVVSVGKSGDKGAVELELYEGDTKVATEIVEESETTDFDGRLDSPIKLNNVFESSSGNKAEIYLTSEEMTLEDGQEDDLEGYDGWKIKAYDSSNDLIIEVYYAGDDDDTWLTFENGVGVGGMMKFPGAGNYGIVFKGFESKPMKELVFDGSDVTFVDADGSQHTGVLFKEVGSTAITVSTDASYAYSTFTVYDLIDGRDAKFQVRIDDSGATDNNVNVNIRVDLDNDGDWDVSWAASDTLVNMTNGTPDTGTHEFSVDFGDYTYTVFVNLQSDDDGSVDTDDKVTSAYVYFYSNDMTTPDEDTPYYVVATDSDSNGIPDYWTVTEKGESNPAVKVPFDTSDKELDFSDGGDDVSVDVDADGTYDETLDADSSNDEAHPENFWTEYGSEVYVNSTNKVTIKVPTEQREVGIFVGQLPEEVETAQTFKAKKGESVQIGDYEVKVEDIDVPSGTVQYTEAVVEPVGTMVYMDNDVPAKNLIVVGSWYVNNVAKAIADANPELYDAIQGEGDWVVDKYTYNGRDAIIVAGYTAEDTGAAAQAFINFLKENLG